MPSENEVTLEQVLAARDQRAKKQKELIAQHNLPLISFTVNIPGSIKKTPDSEKVFWEGLRQLSRSFLENDVLLVSRETADPVTGFEAYIVLDYDDKKLKDITVEIENTHPLGSLLDYDVIGRDGKNLSRESLNYPERKCLLCGNEAHACARNRTHSVEELGEKIKSIVDSYFEE